MFIFSNFLQKINCYISSSLGLFLEEVNIFVILLWNQGFSLYFVFKFLFSTASIMDFHSSLVKSDYWIVCSIYEYVGQYFHFHSRFFMALCFCWRSSHNLVLVLSHLMKSHQLHVLSRFELLDVCFARLCILKSHWIWTSPIVTFC